MSAHAYILIGKDPDGITVTHHIFSTQERLENFQKENPLVTGLSYKVVVRDANPEALAKLAKLGR